MASSPGFRLVTVTPVISLSAAWTVAPAWKREWDGQQQGGDQDQPHTARTSSEADCRREALDRTLVGCIECCVMVCFLLRAWFRWFRWFRRPRRA